MDLVPQLYCIMYLYTHKKATAYTHVEKQLFYSIDRIVWRVQNKRIIAASNQFYILFKVSTRFVRLKLKNLLKKNSTTATMQIYVYKLQIRIFASSRTNKQSSARYINSSFTCHHHHKPSKFSYIKNHCWL